MIKKLLNIEIKIEGDIDSLLVDMGNVKCKNIDGNIEIDMGNINCNTHNGNLKI